MMLGARGLRPALRCVATRRVPMRAPLAAPAGQRFFGAMISNDADRMALFAPGKLAGLEVDTNPAVKEMRTLVHSTLASNPAAFSNYADTNELDLLAFQQLVELIVPSMGKHESKTLFTSMDTSNDGSIQETEIYCDMTMAILANRMKQTVVHPLEGSYFCLPSPPFVPDPKQLQAIQKLKVIFDDLVARRSESPPELKHKPLPKATAPRQQKPAGGLFASMFSSKKAKAPPQTKVVKAEAVPMPNAPKGVYLYGGCGCGKTVLLDLFFRSLPDDVPARRLHYHEFIRDALRAMHSQPKGSNVFEAMADALSKEFRVLLLDELLITHISEAILVKNLFRHMWARGMTVITTSNYHPDDLYAKGFNRDQFVGFIPDLKAQSPVLDISGEVDYRQVDDENSNVFFHSINADTTASMKNAFELLVGGNVELNSTLPIPQEKRNINIPAQGKDHRDASVAQFSFHDLCVQNMGRADYSTIAENFNTVFISGVPKYEPDLGAEFKRFVSLTDILYGKKVVLHLQSEVHTKDLFEHGLKNDDIDLDDLWSFRRCSSMLSEMQNPKYQNMVWLMRNHMLQESALRL